MSMVQASSDRRSVHSSMGEINGEDSGGVLFEAEHSDFESDSERHVSQHDEDYIIVQHDGIEGSIYTSNKRNYNYVSRQKKPPNTKSRSAMWKEKLESLTEAKLGRTTCCKKLNCFKHVDFDFFLERSKFILFSSATTRSSIVLSMLDSENNYSFNNRKVCIRFMRNSFHFSAVMLAQLRQPNNVITESNSGGQSSHRFRVNLRSSSTNSSNGFYRHSPQKDAVISFLTRLAEDCSERMPDSTEVHLPFHQKHEVFNLFIKEYKTLYDDTPPTSHYFLHVWSKNCDQIKVRKTTRFSICDTCDEIRSAMRLRLLKGQSIVDLVQKRARHIKWIKAERLVYQVKKDRARLRPSEYCSIIVDGADQHAYGLPHFITKTKKQTGLALEVKVVGCLEHNVENKLHLYTMTEEHKTGANHIIEVIHRFLNDRRNRGPLPRTFFVQVDNCTRENKNHYFMAYLQSLVALGIFDTVEVGFLPKGHTHEDVDQCFSQTSCRLKQHNAITLTDLHYQLSHANKGQAKVSHMKRVVNWSGLCDEQKCLRKIPRISTYMYFKFSCSFTESVDVTDGPLATTCNAKEDCHGSWKAIGKSNGTHLSSGILKFCSDVNKIPPLPIDCPEGIERVTSWFISEEGRINDSDKLISLHKLRDFVFQSRTDPCHWDMKDTVETSTRNIYQQSAYNTDEDPSIDVAAFLHMEGDDMRECPVAQQPEHSSDDLNHNGDKSPIGERNLTSNSSSQPESRFTYEVGTFVAIQSDEDQTTSSFWIGKVLQTEGNSNESFIRKLKVHWFNPSITDDVFNSPYYPIYTSRKKRGEGDQVGNMHVVNLMFLRLMLLTQILSSYLLMDLQKRIPYLWQ